MRTLQIIISTTAVFLWAGPAASQTPREAARGYASHAGAVQQLKTAGVYDWCFDDNAPIKVFVQMARMDGVTYQQILEQVMRELIAAEIPIKAIRSGFCGLIEPGQPSWFARAVLPDVEIVGTSRTTAGEVEFWEYDPRRHGGTASLISITIVNEVVHEVITVH